MFSNTLGLQGTHQVPRFESLALTNVMWINRPSQLANDSPMTLADKLTESLRKNGDLELASPNLQRNEYVLLPSLRMRGHEFCYELSVYAVSSLIRTASSLTRISGVR